MVAIFVHSAAADGGIAKDGSGNVYVTGSSLGSGGTGKDFATIKYNSFGVDQWTSRYNGTGNGNDIAYGVATDGSGNVYVTGSSLGSGGTGLDFATVKYDSIGNETWVARYNGPGNGDDAAYDITVDASGNIYVTGTSLGSGSSWDYATVKYNSSGTQQWVARYNGTGNGSDGAYSISVDSTGNVYVTGSSLGSGGTSDDFATVKYNSSGTQQWASRYNGAANGSDSAYFIAVDGSGNVYVTGGSLGSGSGDDYATVKYNSSGTQQWASRYNGPANSGDDAYCVVVDGSGNVYVTGGSGGSGTGSDYATVKYNSSGTQQWASRYNGSGSTDDAAYSVAVDSSGNVYVTGSSGAGAAGTNFATLKYNSSGTQQWVSTYNGTANGNDSANSLVIDGSANVSVTGSSLGSGGTGLDYATVKYNSSGSQQWASRYNGTGNGDDISAIFDLRKSCKFAFAEMAVRLPL